MDLVDKQDVPFIQVRQQCRQVAGLFDRGAGGDTDLRPHGVGNDPPLEMDVQCRLRVAFLPVPPQRNLKPRMSGAFLLPPNTPPRLKQTFPADFTMQPNSYFYHCHDNRPSGMDGNRRIQSGQMLLQILCIGRLTVPKERYIAA